MRAIAIVEDNDKEAELLNSYVNKYAEEKGAEFSVTRFSDATQFLKNYNAGYAVVFLDIQMPELNGMDAAIELRKIDKTVSIIFTTSLVQYAQKGYEVDAVSFIVKPVTYYDFALKFKKAIDIYLLNEDRSFTIMSPGGLCRISTDKLMYVEVLKHRLYYHLIDDVIEMTGVLCKIEKELASFGFLKCNNCYLVNPRFVLKVKGQEVQVGDTILHISRPKRAAFLADLANWYAGIGGK